jgi:hypothetical protein
MSESLTPRKSISLGPWLIVVVFALGGLAVAGLGSWNVWHMHRQLTDAKTTTGLVHSAEVRVQRSRDSEGRTRTYYVPDIQFAYQVDGQNHVSTRLYPGAMTVRGTAELGRWRAERIVREYGPESRPTVYYLPHDPSVAFLLRQRRVVNGAFLLVGAILAVAGFGLLPASLRLDISQRFFTAILLFGAAQFATWLIWASYLAVPADELEGSRTLLMWLLVVFVVVCWAALVGNSPPWFKPVRDVTFVSLGGAILGIVLAMFICIPLAVLVRNDRFLEIIPWAAVGMGGLFLTLYACGCLKESTASGDSADDPLG